MKRWEIKLSDPAFNERYLQVTSAINPSLSEDNFSQVDCGDAVQWIRMKNSKIVIRINSVYCELFEHEVKLTLEVGIRSLWINDLVSNNDKLIKVVSALQRLGAQELKARPYRFCFHWQLKVKYENLEDVFRQVHEAF